MADGWAFCETGALLEGVTTWPCFETRASLQRTFIGGGKSSPRSPVEWWSCYEREREAVCIGRIIVTNRTTGVLPTVLGRTMRRCGDSWRCSRPALL